MIGRLCSLESFESPQRKATGIQETHAEIDSANSPRQSFWLLIGLLGIAFVVRAWAPARMAIEHFDEGVYASNFFSGHLDFSYPDRHLYAPPLLPAVYEWTHILTGGAAHAVVWINVILGTLLVAAIWWVSDLTVGRSAAFASATIVCIHGYFIQYSRASLTETPLALFLLLAVGFGIIALRDRFGLAVLGAAICTALAWWTKYNGWLPLVILGAGGAGWFLFERPQFREAFPRMIVWGIIAIGAFLFWLPYLWNLNDVGGYSAVAQNHAGYVVGLSGWWPSLIRHLQAQNHYSTLLGLGIVTGTLIASLIGNYRLTTGSIATLFCLAVLSFPLSAMVIALLLVGLGIYHSWSTLRQELNSSISFWILLAWLLGMLVATPMYRPYPRLFFPLALILVIFIGVGIDRLTQLILQMGKPIASKQFVVGGAAACCISLMWVWQTGASSAWQDRTAFQYLAPEIAAEVRKRSVPIEETYDAIVYIIGEPGLYYYMAEAENAQEPEFDYISQPVTGVVMLQTSAKGIKVPTFILVGPHAPEEAKTLTESGEQVVLIEEFSYQPSDLVLLDDMGPDQLKENRQKAIQLWQLKSH